jgi:drug/metabolite transporter (DMT)-like permease
MASIRGTALIIPAVLLEGLAQLALKRGAMAARKHAGYWIGLVRSPWVGAGIALYVAELLCWIAALHEVPLSIAFPTLSLNYCVVAVGAHLWLDEPLERRTVLGLGLVVTGVALLFVPLR